MSSWHLRRCRWLPAAAAQRVGIGRVASKADSLVVGEHAVEHGPGHADAADPSAIRTHVAQFRRPAKRAVDDIRGERIVIAETRESLLPQRLVRRRRKRC